jgi:hypothetical protein
MSPSSERKNLSILKDIALSTPRDVVGTPEENDSAGTIERVSVDEQIRLYQDSIQLEEYRHDKKEQRKARKRLTKSMLRIFWINFSLYWALVITGVVFSALSIPFISVGAMGCVTVFSAIGSLATSVYGFYFPKQRNSTKENKTTS